MKKIFLVLLCGIMIAAQLCGCGSKNEGNSESGSVQESTIDVQSSTETEEVSVPDMDVIEETEVTLPEGAQGGGM